MKRVISFVLTVAIAVSFVFTSFSKTEVMADTTGLNGFVTRLYQLCLDRDPDPAGFEYWTSRLSSGEISGSNCAAGFIFSNEFINKNYSNSSYVTYLYRILLNREPDGVGLPYWTGMLNDGSTRFDIFKGFVNSQEWIGICNSYGINPGDDYPISTEVTDEDIQDFFSRAVLIGNSVTDGFNMYFNAYGRGIMGNVRVCARGSYSLLNDKTNRTDYLPRLNGTPMRARDIIHNSGCDYAFICMGTNDLYGDAAGRYYEYLDDIRAYNPNVIIFVESCTPNHQDSPRNSDINALNDAMIQYCNSHDNVYYVDVATPLRDSTGHLATEYCSDGGVHVTYAGYRVWADTLVEFAREYLTDHR